MTTKRCPGFGEKVGRCENLPTGIWCADCDEKRIGHITKRLEEMEAEMARRAAQ